MIILTRELPEDRCQKFDKKGTFGRCHLKKGHLRTCKSLCGKRVKTSKYSVPIYCIFIRGHEGKCK